MEYLVSKAQETCENRDLRVSSFSLSYSILLEVSLMNASVGREREQARETERQAMGDAAHVVHLYHDLATKLTV